MFRCSGSSFRNFYCCSGGNKNKSRSDHETIATVDVDARSIIKTVITAKSKTKSAVVEFDLNSLCLSLSKEELTALTVVLLKETLQEAGNPVSGKKSDLINRLLS